jgi:hypothetical protein
VQAVAQGVALDPQLAQLLAQLLHLADLALELGVAVVALAALRPPVELELLRPDGLLRGAPRTFFSMISSMRALFFFSRALKTAMSGLGISSPFLGRGAMTVFSSMRSALKS